MEVIGAYLDGSGNPHTTIGYPDQEGDSSTALLMVAGDSVNNQAASLTGVLVLQPLSTPPPAVAGGIYFDGSSNQFYYCTDGATWTPFP